MYNAANNASSQLAQAISASDTSLTVLDGSSFPDAPFVVSIEDEIIEVGSKSGNTFSALVRGWEGTTPASHPSGARVENRFTAGTYQQIVDKINNLKAEEIEYTSEVTSFTPTQVAAALDALAGVRIVEMGSNANGEYVRWENGLQVCWNSFWNPRPTTTVTGPLYRDDVATMWTFPAAFITSPAVYGTVSGDNTDDHYRLFFAPHSVTTTSVTYRDVATASGPNLGRNDQLLALGRWK